MASAAEKMSRTIVEFYRLAGTDTELSERMSFAQTTVQVHFTDDPSAGVTIYLDRNPITAENGIVGDAEIDLFATSEVWGDMAAGGEILSMAIAKGKVTYTGPVRKYLRVFPILRAFDFTVWRGDGDATASADTAPATGAGPSAI